MGRDGCEQLEGPVPLTSRFAHGSTMLAGLQATHLVGRWPQDEDMSRWALHAGRGRCALSAACEAVVQAWSHPVGGALLQGSHCCSGFGLWESRSLWGAAGRCWGADSGPGLWGGGGTEHGLAVLWGGPVVGYLPFSGQRGAPTWWDLSPQAQPCPRVCVTLGGHWVRPDSVAVRETGAVCPPHCQSPVPAAVTGGDLVPESGLSSSSLLLALSPWAACPLWALHLLCVRSVTLGLVRRGWSCRPATSEICAVDTLGATGGRGMVAENPGP